jgi:hypothetical protein
MAFGDLRGTLTGSGASVGTTNAFSTGGPITVAVGDLVFVCFGQQTALTASGVTDNLGNTYSAQNAGTDSGTATGRAFYSPVTVAGSLSTVTVAATSSANDYCGVVAVIAGPFTAAPLDKSPANTDLTTPASPFTCPATGTLSQAAEVIMAWGIGSQSTTWAATSPNLLANNANSSTNIKAAVGYQVVNSTSTVSPVFTAGSNPTDAAVGTASFAALLMPAGRPPVFSDYRRVFRSRYTYNSQFDLVAGGQGPPPVVVSMPGAAVTMSAGALSETLASNVAIGGAAGTASAGTLAQTIAFALPGAAATMSAGTMLGAVAPAIGGVAATANAGALAPAVAIALPGSSVASSAGSFAQAVTFGLAGTGVSASAGTLAETVALALPGAEAMTGASSPSVSTGGSGSFQLPGVGATSTAGNLTPTTAETFGLSGAAMASAAGSMSLLTIKTVPFVGAAAFTAAANILKEIAGPFPGASTTMAAGAMAAATALSRTLGGAGVIMSVGDINGLAQNFLASFFKRVRFDPVTGIFRTRIVYYTTVSSIIGFETPPALIAAAGSLTPALTSVAAFTGAAATSQAGQIAKTVTDAIGGAQVATAANTFAITSGHTLPGISLASAAGALQAGWIAELVGVSATAFAGVMSAPTSADLALSIPGVQVVSAAGTIATTTALSLDLAGVGLTSAAGALALITITVGLNGASVLSQAGIITTPGTLPLALIGAEADTAAGSISIEAAQGVITGAAATSAAGDFAFEVAFELAGAQIDIAAGDVVIGALTLPGAGLSITAGTLNLLAQQGVLGGASMLAIAGVIAVTAQSIILKSIGRLTPRFASKRGRTRLL